jgi:hypothetical protein
VRNFRARARSVPACPVGVPAVGRTRATVWLMVLNQTVDLHWTCKICLQTAHMCDVCASWRAGGR